MTLTDNRKKRITKFEDIPEWGYFTADTCDGRGLWRKTTRLLQETGEVAAVCLTDCPYYASFGTCFKNIESVDPSKIEIILS